MAVLATIVAIAIAGAARAAGEGTSAAAPAMKVVVVPDLRKQAYVFAKGVLLDAGFAWTVDGPTQGYPSNLVVAQVPAPGTWLVDTGAPTVHLRLARNAQSPEKGNPDGGSPYSGTEVITPAAALKRARQQARAAAKAAAAAKVAEAKAAAAAAAAEKALEERAARLTAGGAGIADGAAALIAVARARALAGGTRADGARASAKKLAAKKLAAKKLAAKKAAAKRAATPVAVRPVAFLVPGAPVEPVKEIPLPDRARRLERWVARRPTPTVANHHWFLYQHAWVVTGARFGWWRGAEALRILAAVDRSLARSWPSARVQLAQAQSALAEVQRRASPAPGAATTGGRPR